ncbi:MAG: hypothetical protein AABW88_00340 [Nanoarchaeota archaeon]
MTETRIKYASDFEDALLNSVTEFGGQNCALRAIITCLGPSIVYDQKKIPIGLNRGRDLKIKNIEKTLEAGMERENETVSVIPISGNPLAIEEYVNEAIKLIKFLKENSGERSGENLSDNIKPAILVYDCDLMHRIKSRYFEFWMPKEEDRRRLIKKAYVITK